MSVTIKDIARLAGVSYSTVSKALNNSPLVRNEKKQRIQELAKQLGYQPNMVAKSLVSRRSMSVGILLPPMDSIATTALLEHIQVECSLRKYDVILSLLTPEFALDFFQRLRTDGIILFEHPSTSPPKQRLTTDLPLVSIGTCPVFSSRFALVDTKRKEAIRQAVRHLVQLGHQHLAYIGVAQETNATQYEKVAGFYEETYAQNLSRETTSLIDTEKTSWADGYRAGRQFVSLPNRPTGVITGSYELTAGFMQALQDHGLTAPDHYSIISYEDLPEFEQLPVAVTSVGTSITTFAQKVASLLFDQLDKSESAQLLELLEPRIVERQSCRTL